MSTLDQKPVDAEAINKGLARLPPGKRRQAASDFAKVAAEVREARKRGTPWAAIAAQLRAFDLNVSIPRLKKMLATTSQTLNPARAATADISGTASLSDRRDIAESNSEPDYSQDVLR